MIEYSIKLRLEFLVFEIEVFILNSPFRYKKRTKCWKLKIRRGGEYFENVERIRIHV